MKYLPLFLLIQVVSLALGVVGVPICALLAYSDSSVYSAVDDKWHWPPAFWIFDNEEDGVDPTWYQKANPTWSKARREFVWTALRNSVNNLRFVPGVSGVGRPLWYRTWTMFGKQFYAKAGWLSDGYPCMSAGSGRGY